MSKLVFKIHLKSIHIKEDHIRKLADIADTDIEANVQDENLAKLLLENVETIRTTLKKHEDHRIGEQWLLHDQCEAEYGIVKAMNPDAPKEFIIMEDVASNPDVLRDFPLWYAAYQASLKWGFSLEWEQIDEDEEEPALPEDAPGSSAAGANQPGKKVIRRNKSHTGLKNSPSPNVPFPSVPANITIAEICIFLPQWTGSRDIVGRILSNGGTQRKAALIMIAHRSGMSHAKAVTSMILKKFDRAMRPVYGADWKPFHFVPAPDHDANSIDVAGFRTQFQLHPNLSRNESNASVNFRTLANDVVNMPSGPDALDLTRFVQYALDNPDQDFLFPDDWATLTQLLGLHPKTDAHTDTEVYKRYRGIRDTQGRVRKQDDAEESDSDTIKPVKKPARSAPKKTPSTSTLKKTPSAQNVVPKRGVRKEEFSEDDSDVSDFKGSKRALALGRKVLRTNTMRRSGRERAVRFEKLDEDTVLGEEPGKDQEDESSALSDGKPEKNQKDKSPDLSNQKPGEDQEDESSDLSELSEEELEETQKDESSDLSELSDEEQGDI